MWPRREGGEVAGDIFTLLYVLERMASGAMGTEQLASESVPNVMRLSVTHNGIKDQLFAHQLTLYTLAWIRYRIDDRSQFSNGSVEYSVFQMSHQRWRREGRGGWTQSPLVPSWDEIFIILVNTKFLVLWEESPTFTIITLSLTHGPRIRSTNGIESFIYYIRCL